MNSFAIYRLPYQSSCTAVVQSTADNHILTEISELDTTAGFVVAPFAMDDESRIVVISPDEVIRYETPEDIESRRNEAFDACCAKNALMDDTKPATRKEYADDFTRFHARLSDGEFQKLVLAREKTVTFDASAEPTKMFAKACHDYPRVFVALFSSPVCGTWLVATPEVLIEREGDRCHTMALAGTMSYTGDMNPAWSDKNIEEQGYVASYIRHSIGHMACNLDVSGPYTVRAAHLVHLRTDFDFTPIQDAKISDMINALHPTPAVCGLPKQEALEFILSNEHVRRGYYSGYCGPVGIDGAARLYVSLRCMRIDRSSFRLYAGGGLLPASTEANEWQETENKMLPMLRCVCDE